mmetsp:Transcript_25266/g.54917  ORF Transcript_25266/g.54917 Transcript_25266/m.54917 type:complete len:682 (+) Transcript_25266:178-2223(+)|eukprot:CAMPEP_0202909582 /NCGR_PEP_ID=MMETSP1392-20130828/49698_1 /ASSEMBLY_ACC=CAM_ASM_000868 /TAXON_ID=225041 /ORGANISM="Chlamydomonas chlamydogama, Strain SAG 11-48b" /LENGTH=681 /DNA_ID=CAMNT_0049599379 /DNA_START=93 /DNA_END=2138 /DNA_ORIENTATION=+
MGLNCKRIWFAAAAAAMFVWKIVCFCRTGRKKGNISAKVESHVAAPERQPLLHDVHSEPSGSASHADQDFGSTNQSTSKPDQQDGLHQPLGQALMPSDQLATVSESDVVLSEAPAVVHRQQTAEGQRVAPLANPPVNTESAAREGSKLKPASSDAQHLNAPPAAPVDTNFLQSLIDKELGPPKFAVRKQSTEAPQHAASPPLEDFIDEQLGPPKFAVPKPAAKPVSAAHGDTGSKPAMRASKPIYLRLGVVSGPVTGKKYEVHDASTQVRIGRTPDCTLQLLDQEVSGTHAMIQYHEQEECWKVSDIGSLNGTTLNGMVISTYDRKPGQPHVLSDQDVLDFGGSTRIKVECSPSGSQPAKRRATEDLDGDGATSSRAPPGSRGQSLALAGPLPPLIASETLPSLQLSLAVHQRLGSDHRRTNTGIEDVVHWEAPFQPFGQHTALFCVFDGHHGSKAASQAKLLMPETLRSKLRDGATQHLVLGRPEEAQRQLLRDCFLETDAKMALDEGCTATVVLAERSPAGDLALQAANVGDSSALLVNISTGQWVKMTEDHRIASSRSERERLQRRGHTVKTRLYGLNISRMLGDKFLKDEDLGFTAEPFVSSSTCVRSEERTFLVLASDGLWDVVTEQRAAGLILKACAEDPGADAALVADIMLNQALMHRSKDDITILVLETLIKT